MAKDQRRALADELKRAIEHAQSASGMRQASIDQIASQVPARNQSEGRSPRSRRRSEPEVKPALISFTPEMLEAVLSGQKTQTRRPVRPLPREVSNGVPVDKDGGVIVPMYAVGQQVFIREKYAREQTSSGQRFIYERDSPSKKVRWISSRFMPTSAARYSIRVSAVSIAKLSTISGADVAAEGLPNEVDALGAFLELWDSIYGQTEFSSIRDPWVWAYEFTLEPRDPVRHG